MSSESLGEFEQLVLIAVLRLSGRGGEEVYGVPVVEEIEARTGRGVSRAAVYVTLRRLEGKGLVRSWMGESRPERGGKARRCVAVTPAGEAAVLEARRVMDRMWGELRPAPEARP